VDNPGWKERGVRTTRWTYGHDFQNGTYELYDRVADPLEMVNLASQPGYQDVLVELERRAAALESCAGQACRRDFGPDPVPSSTNELRH
jgi:arylsulfatase A-like enzyme